MNTDYEKDNCDEKTINLLFMSYGRRDASNFAKRICSDLERNGYHVLRDTDIIQAGVDFLAVIEDGLKKANILVSLLSPHSVRRQQGISNNENEIDSVCLDELSFARFNAKKPIILFANLLLSDGLGV